MHLNHRVRTLSHQGFSRDTIAALLDLESAHVAAFLSDPNFCLPEPPAPPQPPSVEPTQPAEPPPVEYHCACREGPNSPLPAIKGSACSERRRLPRRRLSSWCSMVRHEPASLGPRLIGVGLVVLILVLMLATASCVPLALYFLYREVQRLGEKMDEWDVASNSSQDIKELRNAATLLEDVGCDDFVNPPTAEAMQEAAQELRKMIELQGDVDERHRA